MMLSNKPVTCIDIGTDSIKFLSGIWKPDKTVIHEVSLFKFQPEAYQKYGFSIQLENLALGLSEHKVRDQIIMAVHFPKNPIYSLTLPKMPETELYDAIKWELTEKKNIGYPFLMDYINDTSSFDGTENQRTFVHLQPKEDIEKIIESLGNKKGRLQTVEYPSFSLVHSLVKLGTISTNKAYLILNFGATFTNFLIIHNYHLVFERKLNTGGIALTKTVADYCKLDYENAEKLKQEHGISTDVLSDKIIESNQILTSSLEKLISDIQYSMKYFSFQVTKSKITSFEKILLTGGGACLPGLRNFIKERLDLDCSIVDFSEKVTLPKSGVLEGINNPWPLLNTALGLGFWNTAILNEYGTCLLPESYRKKDIPQSFSGQIRYGFKSAYVLLTLLVALAFMAFLHLKKLDQTIFLLNENVKNNELTLKAREKNIEINKKRFFDLEEEKKAIGEKLNKLSEKLNEIRLNQNSSFQVSQTLIILSKIIPEKVFLTQVRFKENALHIKGVSTSHELISKFMKTINDQEFFRSCNFLFTKTQTETENIEFELKVEKK